ncbi:MAG TPA: response regulator [Burkholderiales bacterium]|jgi:CheY-like chemotaxis protein|nr:response regulator [Burkholderiales bacterium]
MNLPSPQSSNLTASDSTSGSGLTSTINVPVPAFRAGTRIVVAEDDRVSQAVLTMILQKFGLDVHLACDGVRALELIREVEPALVMMDMQMPLMDGAEVIRVLRSDSTAPQPPVVVLSGNRLSQAQMDDLHALGVLDFLLKPVNRGRLHGVLSQVLPLA